MKINTASLRTNGYRLSLIARFAYYNSQTLAFTKFSIYPGMYIFNFNTFYIIYTHVSEMLIRKVSRNCEFENSYS